MTPTSIDFADFFDYLLKARGRLLDWVRAQPADVYTRKFQIGLGSLRATLVHIAEREWGYAQRLAGTDYGRDDLPFTEARYPEFEGFEAAWMRQAPATRQVLARIDDPDASTVKIRGDLTLALQCSTLKCKIEKTNRGVHMERQLTLRMPADLATKLEKVARHTRRRRSEIIRLALEQFLGEADTKVEGRPIDLVRDLLGSMESGVPDLGQRHRDHLLRRLRRAH